MLALRLAEAVLPAILVLFARIAVFDEKCNRTKNFVLIVVSFVLSATGIFAFSLNAVCSYAVALSICVAAELIIEKNHRCKVLYSALIVHLLICSGYFFLFAIGIELRIIMAHVFCFLFLTVSMFFGSVSVSVTEKKRKILKVITLSLVLILTLVLFLGVMGNTVKNIISGILMLILAYEFKWMVDKEEAERQYSCQIEQYQENLSQMYDTMRMFRHNYKNIAIGIKGCLKEKNYQEMEQLLESVEIGIDDAAFKQQMSVLSQFDDASVKWLLISKLSAAQKYKINTSLVISKHINIGSMKKSDFNVILGNLLDNAVEAASESENKLLKIAIFNKNGDTIVSVKNTYGKKPALGRIFDKGYSEKQGHMGIGLYGVKKIADSYANVLLDVRILNDYFTVDLNISGAVSEKQHGDV